MVLLLGLLRGESRQRRDQLGHAGQVCHALEELDSRQRYRRARGDGLARDGGHYRRWGLVLSAHLIALEIQIRDMGKREVLKFGDLRGGTGEPSSTRWNKAKEVVKRSAVSGWLGSNFQFSTSNGDPNRCLYYVRTHAIRRL